MMLDGESHRRRKAMFLSLMGREASKRLAEIKAARWRARLDRWERMERVVLLDEAHLILCGAVCEWAGIPLSETEAAQRAREFAAMIDGTGSVGPRNGRGHRLRARTERWTRGIIRRVRRGELAVPDGSAAHVIARHCDLDGKPMLAAEMRYEVPEQDLRIDLARVPAPPESRLVMRNVRQVHGTGG